MEEARRCLRRFDVGDKLSRLPLPRAAVLLPLMVRGARLHLLLTVRSMQSLFFAVGLTKLFLGRDECLSQNLSLRCTALTMQIFLIIDAYRVLIVIRA
ncbi:hypothetical protein DUI87_13907 [Hirundo rustica rustica]|uniref:Uncharacterized protein n=1 Tax=Hirundo rustica rustica TaxID=333673 RepID=A0A3M0K6T8_HIRRU|nr:hypothetical protein DUI87_34232 [Hirundo rustica rustica]RMC08913.1 hypothetical protein DUI87_13907 [Hirundo rustica rustica]